MFDDCYQWCPDHHWNTFDSGVDKIPMSMISEILEQPSVVDNLLNGQMAHVENIVNNLRHHEIYSIIIAARGSSDNAGLYAKYLFGASNRMPVLLATPSLFSIYRQPPHLHGALVIGISQSGKSPDIISVLAEGRRQGCPTLAISNDPDSPLVREADLTIDIRAGKERAVAATKTYSASLMAIAMLSVALKGDSDSRKQLAKVSRWMEQCLVEDEAIEENCLRYRYMENCVILGRGYNYATVFEWSLKLKELCYIIGEPYSSADFLHGPIALVERGFPVLAVAPSGAVFDSMLTLLSMLKDEYHAELLIISDTKKVLDIATVPIVLPQNIPEWLTPLVSIVPAQLFSYHLTRAKGYNPEAPRGLHKVTETW